jgi:hypothetical protein
VQRFPGVLHLQPDDLGFNAVTIPPATTVNGIFFPALAQCRFDNVQFVAIRSGVSTQINVDVLLSVDGVNPIGAGNTAINAITGTTRCYGYFDGTNALGDGVTVVPAVRFCWFYPYLRIALRNTDGVNAAVMTVNLFLNLRDRH